jgi:hypothetical protein
MSLADEVCVCVGCVCVGCVYVCVCVCVCARVRACGTYIYVYICIYVVCIHTHKAEGYLSWRIQMNRKIDPKALMAWISTRSVQTIGMLVLVGLFCSLIVLFIGLF